MKISVVIPVYNASQVIGDCLKGLESQTRPADEIIMVDNGSCDDSCAIIQKFSDENKKLNIFLYRESKKGPSAARNCGAQKATGDIIVFTDDDCIADSRWLAEIQKAFESDPALEFLGGIPEPFIAPRTLMEKFLSAFWLTPKDFQKAFVPTKLDLFAGIFISTFNCAYKRKLFYDLQGFDESLLIGEDFDIYLRAINRGAKLSAWDVSVMVCHKQNISFQAMIKKFFRYGLALALIVKRYYPHQVILKVPGGYRSFRTPFFTIVLMGTFMKLSAVLIILSMAYLQSFLIFAIVFGAGAVFLFFHVRRLISRCGCVLTFKENLLVVVYYVARQLSEELGRAVGSIKQRIICL